MKALHEAILKEGRGLGHSVVKVDSFLNHRVDTALCFQMGEAVARHFAKDKPTLVLTVEASGIALAMACAHALGDVPVLFAKKTSATNQSADMLTAPVYSFTHQKQYMVRVDGRYLPQGARVLIVDDFLADGQAVNGLLSLCEQAGALHVGVAIAIEKGFQKGGADLRERGINLLSLAVVERIEDGVLTLAPSPFEE